VRKRYRVPPIVIGLVLSFLASGAVFPGSSYANTVRIARTAPLPLRRHALFKNAAVRKPLRASQAPWLNRAHTRLARTVATSVRLFRPLSHDRTGSAQATQRSVDFVSSMRLLSARRDQAQRLGGANGFFAPSPVRALRSVPASARPATNAAQARTPAPVARLRARRMGAARPVQATQVRTSIGSEIARDALSLVGRPYVWGGASPAVGFDCSGLVQYVLSEVGIAAPRTSWEQFEFGAPVSTDQLLPGDLLFFATYATGASHVGIYIGNGEFVNALNSSTGVIISALSNPYFASRLLGARSPYAALAQSS